MDWGVLIPSSTLYYFLLFLLGSHQYQFLKAFGRPFPLFWGRRVNREGSAWEPDPQSVGHMEVLWLLPTTSWTVLVPLVTQELNYHPQGSDEEQRDGAAAPVHQRKFLLPNTSVLSISSKGKQTNCVYGQEREWRSGLRRFQGVRG